MLKIKELSVSKELDRDAMAGVTGGMDISGLAGLVLNLASPVNAPKVAEIAGIAASNTGPVTSTTVQDDRDIITNVGYGQVVNTGGNHATTNQMVTSFAQNFLSSLQA